MQWIGLTSTHSGMVLEWKQY